MTYVAIAKMSMKSIGNISASYLKDADIDASNIVSEANTYASNLVRTANNTLSAARSSLAYSNQSRNNNRVLQNAGSAAEAATVNYRRARDNALTGSVEDQIAFAEQAGAQASVAAFSGLTGGVVDVVRGATALRQSRIQQRTAEMLKQGDYDASKQASRILQAGWDSLDTSDLTATIDYSRDVAQTKRSNSSLFFDIIGGQDTQDLANVTDKVKGFFKSPGGGNADKMFLNGAGYGD